MALQSTPRNEGKMLIKHVFDFAAAILLTLLLLPLLSIIALAIKSFSRGPVLYKQERMGMNGRLFIFYKFRTMVLKTQMSLVGPRPPIPEEVDEYSVWQRRRLSMKPGMTCLWQIAPGRNDLSFEDWMKLDLKYIDNWSIFNDFKILVLTAKAVLTGAGR